MNCHPLSATIQNLRRKSQTRPASYTISERSRQPQRARGLFHRLQLQQLSYEPNRLDQKELFQYYIYFELSSMRLTILSLKGGTSLAFLTLVNSLFSE